MNLNTTNRPGEVYTNLAEADRQRSSRSAILQGNLYPLVWVILTSGFISAIYGLIHQSVSDCGVVASFMNYYYFLGISSAPYFHYYIDMPLFPV